MKEVLYFTAKWCKPCQKMKPLLKSLESEFKDEITFTTVDVDIERELTLQAGVEGMPTFVFLQDNKELHRFVGADEGKLDTFVRNLANM